jgi:hypothetical protein
MFCHTVWPKVFLVLLVTMVSSPQPPEGEGEPVFECFKNQGKYACKNPKGPCVPQQGSGNGEQ